MLASPGPWRLGVAVALRSRSPQTAVKLARSGSIRFYSILQGGQRVSLVAQGGQRVVEVPQGGQWV